MQKTRNKKSGLVAISSEAKDWEYRKSLQASWDDGGKGLTLGTNFWSGSGGLKDLSQRTGLLGLHSGNYRATYSSGERIFAGAYFSVRRGSHIQRIGVDAPFVQDFFQNGIHMHIIKGPYFNTNFGSDPNIFIQNFTQNPWTLYSK